MTAPTTHPAPADLTTGAGLTLNVLRTSGPDCSNNGITAHADRLTIVGTFDPDTGRIHLLPHRSQVHAVRDDAPAVLLTWGQAAVRRTGFGHRPRLIDPAHLIPVDADEGTYRLPLLFHGGTYANSYDSRYSDQIDQVPDLTWPGAPIEVWDRRE